VEPSGRLTGRRRFAGSFDPGAGLIELAGEEPARACSICRFAGTLDNAEVLRRELGRRGAGLNSDGDLLAAGFRRWGAELPRRLRGDFVFLVWDEDREEGLLVRDQLGVRPLFLKEAAGRVQFAGELRDLLDLLPATPPPDAAGLAHWIALSARPGTGTLYSGITKLGPGELLRFGRHGVRRERYWEPRFQEPLPLSPEHFGDRVREGLREAVCCRVDREAKTGVLLSGGLDSAAVAAVAPKEALVCSGVFPEHPEADEAELIAALGRELGLGGPLAVVRPGGLVASAVEHLAAWRAPLLGWGDFWTLPLLRAAAAQGVGTILDGDGGDELFGPRVYALADELCAGRPRRVLELARRLPGAGGHIGRREEARMIASLALAGSLPPWPQGPLPRLAGRRGPPWLARRTRRELHRSEDPGAWKRLDGPRWWAASAHGIAYGIEATGVFEHQRRRAAMAGLEARHPMLDLDLVELCLRQPPELTLDPRFSRPILRTAMAGLVPDPVRLRPRKALFESLIVSCITGPDAAAVRAILTSPRAELGAFVDLEQMVHALFGTDRALKGDPLGWMWQVWRLLNAELWLRSLPGANGFVELKRDLSSASVEIRER
jgi:asparagine synthase (glutamine-hydrolysing)